MKFRNFAVICILMLLVIPSTVKGAVNAIDILSKAKKAAGGNAWDEISTTHVQMKITTGGLEGTAEGWENVLTGQSLSRYQLGPITGEDGYDGEIAWTKDSSGQVRRREGDDEREGAVNESYRVSLAYWYPERFKAEIEYSGLEREDEKRYHIIRLTPDGGRPFDIWVDAETWLINRTVEKSAIETRTVFFSGYRSVNGVKYPFSSRSTNGETKYDFFVNIESVEFNVPLEGDLFAMPAPPPPDFIIEDGQSSTTIPFKLLNNHIYVEIELNGLGPYLVICDTGGANIVTPTLAEALGLEPEGRLQGRGAGEESEDISLVKIETLSVGDVTLKDQLFLVFPLESFSDIEGVPQHGLIGYEVFKRFVVKIDYENSVLTLTLPETFAYEGNGTVLPFQFNGRIPQVEGSIDGIPGKFDIDTGARSSLHLMGPFVEKHGLINRYRPEVSAVTGWGVGGSVRSMVTRAEMLRLGEIEFPAPVTELSLQSAGAFTDIYVAGNVGTRLLKQFNITFDYERQEMIFEANANRSEPDVYDRSGMWINKAGPFFEVVDVTVDGPASSAGLEVGDTILSVDGESTYNIYLPALRQRFLTDPAGTEILLRVKNDDGEREVTLTLKDLV